MTHEEPKSDAPVRPKRLISVMEAYSRFGISRSEGDRRVANDPNFPKKLKIGVSTVRFLESDVDAYIDLLIERSTSKSPSSPMPQLQTGMSVQTTNNCSAPASDRSCRALARATR